MLSNRQAFKFAFLYRCAEENLSSEETDRRIEKAAAMMEKPAELGDTLMKVLLAAGAIGTVGTLVTGAGLGLTAAGLTSKEIDPAEVKRQELIGAYDMFANQMKQQNLMRQAQGNEANRKAFTFA